LGKLFANRALQGLLVGFFLFNFAFAGFTSIFALSLRDRYGWGPDHAAGVFAFIGVVSAVVQGGLIRRLLPAFGEARLSLWGLAIVGLAFVLTAVVPGGVPLYLSQGVLAVGVGLATPALRGLLSHRTSASEQGRVLGGATAVVSLTQILGPTAAGWSYDHLGRLTPFWAGALVMIAALAWVLAGLKPQKS
jgi:MFS family permease